MLMGRSIYKPHVFSSCWVRRYVPGEDTESVIQGLTIMPLVPSYGVDEGDMTADSAAAAKN